MTQSLADKIKQGVTTGTQPDIGLSELLAQPSLLPGPMHLVEIDIADLPPLSDIYRIASLLPGVPIGQWLPKTDFLNALFNNGIAQLDYVAFTVDVAAGKIASIVLRLNLGTSIAPIKLSSGMISATVTQLNVALYPDVLSATLVDIAGTLTLGSSLTLDASLSCPSLAFSAAIPPTALVHISDVTSAFGLTVPSDVGGMIVSALALDFNVREQTASLQAGVRTADANPLPIIPNVLGLDAIDIGFDHAPSSTDITLAATLTVRNTIVLSVQVTGGTDQDWVITGGIDIPATAANFGGPTVTIANLLEGALGVTLPSEFNFLSTIALLKLDATVTLGTPRTWSLDVELAVSWNLAGTLITADTTIQVGNDGTKNSGSVTADLRIGAEDGPGLSLLLDYQCTASGNKSIHIGLPQLKASTDYVIGTETLTVTISPQSLGDLIGDVAEIFTGNPYVVLPSPWGDILNAVKLPGTTVTVNLKTKAVTITCAENISFFGNTITGIGLGYDPSKPAGSRLSFIVNGTLPVLDNKTTRSWDPTKPGDAPPVPGQGSKLVDIQMVAVGQYVQIAVDDSSTVESTLTEIAAIATTAGGSDPDKLPTFSPTAGWMVGTHIVFKSAVDFQFVFADPVIYGAVVKVAKQKDTPAAIAALDGLYAEILYRKVTSSIGVYEGMLTLPDTIRKIDYGAFLLQLPSISVDIYTNGDFLIDVGFPHNGDFSKSAVINAGQYIGAGGVYYGHLSGPTASALPTVSTLNGAPIGVFNTVTEIGIGLRVGIGKSFSEGPLSASISVVIQAIFEGLFSTYTQLPLPPAMVKDPNNPVAHPEYGGTTDYYKIVASLGIVGQLQGSIDFAIITASLLVEIKLIATVQAESHKAVQVDAEVAVDVELTVSINLGLFSIHIHCSFSMTVRFHTSFGSDAPTVPWGPPDPPAQLRAAFHAARLMAAAAALNFRKPPCQGVPTNLYVAPQLSRSLVDVSTPSGTVNWIYTLQFALPVGVPAPQGAFADLAKFVTAWTVDAFAPHTGTPTTPDQFYASLTIDVGQIDTLVEALKAIPDSSTVGQFDAALNDFFAQNQFTLSAIPPSLQNTSFGFLPVLPPLALSSQVGGAITPPVAGVANDVLRAYALLIATTVLNAIKKANTGSVTLTQGYQSIGADLGGAVGMATRFMLHGTRHSGPGVPLQPLYRATGQEMTLNLSAAKLSVTVTEQVAGAWGVTVPGGALTLASDDAQNTLHTPADIKTYVTAVTPSVTVTTMPATVVRPTPFAVKQGVVAPLSLRGLSRPLMASAGSTTGFSLYDKNDVAVPAASWSWCSTIDFRVQKVPDSSTPGAFLPDVYTLVAVRSDGLDRLEDIYVACNGTPNFSTLEIAYGVDANQVTSGNAPPPTFVTVDPSKIFLFQSNISTETNPPRLMLMMARARAQVQQQQIDPKLTFLGRLLTGGLTNSGGYYLYLKLDSPPAPALFDTRGMAWLTLVVSGFTNASGAVPSYYSALRISDQTYAGDVALTIHSPNLTAPQATIDPGFVGVQIARADWSNENDSKYQRSLDGLFNLIDCEPAAFASAPPGANWPIVPGNGYVVGPIKTDLTTGTTHIYRAQFDLLAIIGQAPETYPNLPNDAANPYQFAGAQLALGFGWVDFYGNTLPPGFSGNPLAISLVDPLLGLDDWPGLSYGFLVTGTPSAPQLTVKMTYIPTVDGQIEEPAYRQYIKIYHQLKTATVTAEASFVKAALAIPTNPTSAADVLRAHIKTIINAQARVDLTPPLTFPLPTPITSTNYDDDLLLQLIVSLRFVRPGPVAAGLESNGDNPILVKRTALAPFQDAAAQQARAAQQKVKAAAPALPLGYNQFATDLEATLAPLGVRVMGGDLDVPGGAKFWLLRWQGAGLQIAFQAGGMGFAPTPIATALQSRSNIDPTLFASYPFPSDYFIASPLNVDNMDMDAVLSGALTAIESFLSPEYAIPAAIAARDQVDACIALKQSLAQALSARVVALSNNNAAPPLLTAATTKYQQACLLDLRNFYAVDAAAALQLKATAQKPVPDLILYGHSSVAQGSNVTISAGQSRIAADATIAMSLSARHKDWQATFDVPNTFHVEALELVTGTIDVIDPDEPQQKPRKYVTGTWLRFITDEGLDLDLASPLNVPLPLRSYPPSPTLSAQSYSQVGGTQLDSVKSWSLDCTYRHQFAAQDTVHITAVLNQPPSLRMVRAAARALDLLDALALFNAVYPSIRSAFESNLRWTQSTPTPTQNTLDAITSFVLLVRCITENFHYVPQGANIPDAPPGTTFELVESFTVKNNPNPDPATTPWHATLTKTDDVTGGLCPAPIVVIDQTPGGQPPSDATLYRGVPVQDQTNPNLYTIAKFLNGSQQPLMAIDALGNPSRTLQVRPLDIIDWHSGRYYLQIIRNETMPASFQYVTPVISAKDRVLPFIDNSDAEVDLSKLPTLIYGPGGPTPNSFGDILARLYHGLLNGQTNSTPQPGSMRTEVSLAYPLAPGTFSQGGPAALPDVRVPLSLELQVQDFTFYPKPDQAWAMAQLLGPKVEAWLKGRVNPTIRPDLYASAQVDVTVTVFSATSEVSLPMIYIDGLFVKCNALAQ